MSESENAYYEEIIEKISQQEKWPKINNNDLIIRLLRIANSQYKLKTIEGSLSSILIYQQVLEEYLINLVKLSNLYLQAEIWPTQLNLKVKEKLMFGQLLDEHKRTIEFDKKIELLQECREFNETRNKFVHHLLKFHSDQEVLDEAKHIYDKFYAICDLYWESRAFVEWKLHDLKHRIDWDELK